jgi:hypothetical protein
MKSFSLKQILDPERIPQHDDFYGCSSKTIDLRTMDSVKRVQEPYL